MNKVNLKELYELQAGLDAEIASKHNVTYESTHEKRLLALIIELGELANETRCFKYWSLKGPSAKEVVMDEFADGLHFLLSLGIPLNVDKFEYEIIDQDLDLTSQFHHLYSSAINLKDNYDLNHYIRVMQAFLNMTPKLGISPDDVISAYKTKLAVNYQRQENKY